jgi:hypothetical protein
MKADAKPTFPEVAKLIAKGPPPDWLVEGLEGFSEFVGGDPVSSKGKKQGRMKIALAYDATDRLIKFLPLAFSRLPYGVRYPDEVAIALSVLPKIKERLAKAMNAPRRRGGQNPNVPRKVCADVVIEAWRIVRGNPEPESHQLWTACNEYWQACDREYRGSDVDTWRSDCRDAVANNRGEWIRQIFLALKGRN